MRSSGSGLCFDPLICELQKGFVDIENDANMEAAAASADFNGSIEPAKTMDRERFDTILSTRMSDWE